LNVAFGSSFFWDGRAATLEEQALLPIADARELGSSVEEVVTRLRADAGYAAAFKEAFGAEGVTGRNLGRALASFERTLLAGDSAVDRFRAGNSSTLNASQRHGMWLFESRGRCWRCHSGDALSDGRFHNTGVGWGGADLGRFAVTKRDADRGAFKTPALRGVARTAPYMHDGSLKSLEEVVRYYSRGGNRNPHLDSDIKPLNLSEQEVKDLVAFLEALTGRTAWEKSGEQP
jgi:cytochrome c peroxidase